MAMQHNAVPSWNFEDNIHYMDCHKLFNHNIRLFFKAIPAALLLHRDPYPALKFLYVEVLDTPGSDMAPEKMDDLNQKVSDYFENTLAYSRAQGVAKLDWKKLG